MKEWLRRYNRKYKHNLKKEDILEWDLSKSALPECGNKIYEFIENPKLYDKVEPIPYALEGINALRNLGFEIIYATYSTIGVSGRKIFWLKDHGFWNEKDHYAEIKDKFLLSASVIIDDNPVNVQKFQGYLPILFSAPWNKNFVWKYRINSWKEIIDKIEEYKSIL
jgi:5'(3')-deoxyribonucleotidase